MKNHIKKLLLLLVTIVFLYFVFVNLDIKEFLGIIKSFDIKYIFFLMISIVVSLSFRAICFKQLISKTINPPLKELIPLCLTGASLNIVLPARAGDIFRAFFLGQKYKVDKVKVFGTIMLERIFDVFMIFCLLLVGIFVYNRNDIAMHLCTVAGICILVGCIFVYVAYKFNKVDKICSFLIEKTKKLPFSNFMEKILTFFNNTCNSFCNGFEVIDSPKRIIAAILASVGIWTIECLNYFIVIQGFGYEVHWSVTIFIICFIALACMVPSTSIFIGPYQVAVIAAFSIYNIGKETALAISFVEQMVVTITTTIFAAIFLIKNNISYKELKEDIKDC